MRTSCPDCVSPSPHAASGMDRDASPSPHAASQGSGIPVSGTEPQHAASIARDLVRDQHFAMPSSAAAISRAAVVRPFREVTQSVQGTRKAAAHGGYGGGNLHEGQVRLSALDRPARQEGSCARSESTESVRGDLACEHLVCLDCHDLACSPMPCPRLPGYPPYLPGPSQRGGGAAAAAKGRAGNQSSPIRGGRPRGSAAVCPGKAQDDTEQLEAVIDLGAYFSGDPVPRSDAEHQVGTRGKEALRCRADDGSDENLPDDTGGDMSSSPSALLVYCERGDVVRAEALLASLSKVLRPCAPPISSPPVLPVLPCSPSDSL